MDSIVAIAGSAGGIEVLSEILSRLPCDLGAPVCVVIHLSARYASRLDLVLGQTSNLPVKFASDGDLLQSGQVYLAPPNLHLAVTCDRTLSLSSGPKLHFTRPSAEPLFESATRVFTDRTILVTLSGMGRNGSCALPVCKSLGAAIIVQDPETARWRSMPDAAIQSGCADYVLPPEDIAAQIVRSLAAN